VPERLSDRAEQILDVAEAILEEEGGDALTMRRLAEELAIKAPSLYKHFADKAAIETALIARAFERVDALFAAAGADLADIAVAYRRFAMTNPHLYRLMTERPLRRDLLPAGLEDRVAAHVWRATGEEHSARAAWAFAHGMCHLELAGRFPPDADLEEAWRRGVQAFRR
jgi:AcrR family transcriptional regulator